MLDDSTFNVLSSCIIYNQIDIITHVQQDPNFLRDIVKLFVDEEMLGGPREAVPQVRKTSAPSQIPGPPQLPVIINLNPDGDSERDPAAMDVDPKPPPPPPPPKSVNGATNGRIPQARRSSYAFAPPENMTDEEVGLRREVILLVQQLCVIGKNVQLPARMTLFRSLVDRGVLFAVQWALGLPEKEEANKPMISAAGEILSALLDHDLNGVRGHVLKQVMVIEKERDAGRKGADKAETILEMVCRLMATSRDFAVQSQVGDALKAWMEIPTADSPTAPSEANVSKQLPFVLGSDLDSFFSSFSHLPRGHRLKRMIQEPSATWTTFTNTVCTVCLGRCTTCPNGELSRVNRVSYSAVAIVPDDNFYTEPVLVLTREETNRFVYLCDLMFNFLQQHNFRSSFYVLSTGLMTRLATLLKSKDKHLRHGEYPITLLYVCHSMCLLSGLSNISVTTQTK